MAKQNKPAIRFKEFTDAWEQRKAKDLCSISTGKSNTQDRVDDGIYPFYVRSPIVEHSNRYLFDEEAVLTVGDGVGTGKVFHYVNGKYDLHQRVYRMFDFSEEITAKYFYYYFSNHFYDRVMAMTAKTSVDSVRYEMIADMDIALPKVKEQMAISAYFDRLDHLITLHQRKYDKLQVLKKAMLEKMFPKNSSGVPEIRFKGFTDAWEQRKAKDLCSISTGKSNTQDRVDDGIYPFYVRSPIVEHSNRYLFDEEAVLTVGDGVGTGKVFHYVNGKYDLHQRVYRMFDFSEEITAKYFYYYFSNHFYDRVMAMTAKTSVDSVRYEMIADMDIALPKVKEQMAISAYFDRLDHLITLHQRKYDKLQVLKKAMLEKMFPKNSSGVPEIRFKGFTDAWEQRKLGEVVERITRKNENLESTLPLTISAQYGLINQNEFFDKRIASKDVSGYFLVRNGEFAYNKSTSSDAPWGAIKRLDRYESGVLSTLYIVFKISDERKTSSDYIVTYYNTDLWHKGIQAIAAEGARNHGLLNVAPADFFETSLTMPKDYAEQQKIGSFFQQLDNLITLHQRELEKLQNIKKSMLEKMFV